MIEASGLAYDQTGLETASRGTDDSQFEAQLRSSVVPGCDQLRQTTLETPLRSLFLALGIWVARRR